MGDDCDGDVSPASPVDRGGDERSDWTPGGYDRRFTHYNTSARALTGFVRRSFKAYWWPIIASLLMEITFCTTMSIWSDRNEEAGVGAHSHWNIFDESNLKEWYWSVFCFCLSMRLLAVGLWKLNFLHLKDSTYASLYMLFASIQWVFYLAAYYWLHDELTALIWTPVVQVQYNVNHFDPITPSGYRKVHDMTIAECMKTFDAPTCRNLTNQQVKCKMLFNDTLCASYTWIGTKSMGPEKCCVRNRYSLSPPVTKVPFTSLEMMAFFPIFQWLATLVMDWMMRDTPMLPATSHYSSYMNGLFLDILDAVLFGDYLLNEKVWYPTYGIDGDTGYTCEVDKRTHVLIWRTWVLALSTAVLSPVVYTLARRENAHAPRRTGGPNLDDGLKHLMKEIRLLDRDAAHEELDTALTLQKEQYMRLSRRDDVHAVMVHDDSPSIFRGVGRRATARLSNREDVGFYRVRYESDDEEEDVVPINHIEPILEEPKACGPGCCRGWFDFSGCRSDRFERMAQCADAMRSLFFLELPFFLWRLQLDGRDVSTNLISLLMLKNLVWGITDFLTILACGNEDATCLAGRPIRWVTEHVNGTILAFIWVGPGGFFRIAADAVVKSNQDRLAAEKQRLTVHKAWLILEREKAYGQYSEKRAVASYDEEIRRLEAEIAVVDKEARMTHI